MSRPECAARCMGDAVPTFYTYYEQTRFKVADLVMKVEKVREKSIEGYDTGDWGPLMLEVESWVLSGLTASVAISLFSGVVSTFLVASSLPATALMIAGIMVISYLSSFIDANAVDELNREIIPLAH
ncbi:TPA: hypothetical protein N5H07_005547 [Salmonella enterica subsp. enterica serovar Paratyphi B]|nr:hypothetical protein [Salmonella enterica subsp. enterica serovar Paratyphi B]